MKKTMLIILIISGITFAQRFGASMGTGTYGYILGDDNSPKHLTGHYYYHLNKNFSFDFSIGVGGTTFNREVDYDPDSNRDDYENSIKVTGGNLEASMIYVHKVTGNPFMPYAGVGLGIYSYSRDEDNEDDTYESEASSTGLAQFLTFGLDMAVSEKITGFLQFKKLGFSMIRVTDERNYRNDDNDREEIYDYVAKPGLDDLGISAGIKFSF